MLFFSEGRVTVNESEITLGEVSKEIIGGHLPNVNELLINISGMIHNIALKRKKMGAEATNINTLSDMGLEIDVEDYRLLPGGHWIPTSCEPRWKVMFGISSKLSTSIQIP